MKTGTSKDSLSLLLVGCGNMGMAMLKGWVEKSIKPENIVVVGRKLSSLEPAKQLGCQVYTSPEAVPASYKPDVVIFSVKPQVIKAVVADYKEYAFKDALFLSIAAGCELSQIEHELGADAAVIRAMPNTPAVIKRGMLVCCPNSKVTPAHREKCNQLMSAIGMLVWIEDENLMDAVTGLSGSGPAYVFHMIEAMTAAGIAVGLPAELAGILAKGTVAGAGELAFKSPVSVARLRQNVTSPNGTTAAGLNVLMAENALGDLLARTVSAATYRSKEIRENTL